MKLSYNAVPFFPSMVHEFKNPEFGDIKNDLIEYVYNERKNDPKGESFSNIGGWQSKPFKISDENNIIHSYIYDSITNFTVINQDTRMYVDAWMNINPKGARNEKHTHPSCAFAGVIWLKIPENSGNLFFYSPFGHIGIDEIMAYDQDFVNSFHVPHTTFTTPEEGKMLIFSSHLEHSVSENNSDEDRISISFNIRIDNNY